MHVFIEQFVAGNFSRRIPGQHPGGIQKVNALAGMGVRRIFYDLIDAGVRPKGERVIIPGQFKFAQGLRGIRQRKVTTSHAKLQLGVLRIDGRRPGILLQRRLIIPRGFESDASLVKAIPFRLLSLV